MPLNQQSNHGIAVLHYSLQNGERTLQTDVQQGFKILPTRFLIHYVSCRAAPLSRLRAAEGRQSHTICRQLRSSTVSISPLLHLLSSKRNNAELKYCVKKQCVLDLQSSRGSAQPLAEQDCPTSTQSLPLQHPAVLWAAASRMHGHR